MLRHGKFHVVVLISICGVSLVLYNSLMCEQNQAQVINHSLSKTGIFQNYDVEELYRSWWISPSSLILSSTTANAVRSNTTKLSQQNPVMNSTDQLAETRTLSSDYLNKLYRPTERAGEIALTKEGIESFKTFKTGNKFIGGEEPYLSERKDLLDRCSEESINPVVDLSRMVYDDKHKIVMCVVPKNACTSWKRVLWYLLGRIEDKSQLRKINAQFLVLDENGKLPVLSSLSNTEALEKLLSYSTFFVSRSPFERLLSAHSSKFTNRTCSLADKKYYHQIGRDIASSQALNYLKGIKFEFRNSTYSLVKNSAFARLDKNEQESALAYIDSLNTWKIPFDLFAQYVANEYANSSLQDVHWRPQTALCNPCALRYDYTIKFERLAQDSNHLLKYVQRFDPKEKQVFFNTRTTALINKNLTLNEFLKLNSYTTKQLSSLYKRDFRVLGYHNFIEQ